MRHRTLDLVPWERFFVLFFNIGHKEFNRIGYLQVQLKQLRAHTYTPARTHAHTYMYAHTDTHTDTHRHTHTHTHTHTHSHTCLACM